MDFRNVISVRNNRGMRDNNPLNVSDSNWQGEVDVDTNSEGEAIFSDMSFGIRAAALNLYSYYYLHGRKTIQDIINNWAPASDGNDPISYAQYVSDQTGIGVNEFFDFNSKNIKAIMKAMANEELGKNYAIQIPDTDWDNGLNMTNKSVLAIAATGGSLIILFLLGLYYFIQK